MGARVAGALGLLVAILVGTALVDRVDLPLAALTAETVVLLLACMALRLRSSAAGEDHVAKDWAILESAIFATPVVCLALFATYALFWPPAMAFYCAVLAAPVVALSMGYFPIALLRRSHADTAPRSVVLEQPPAHILMSAEEMPGH
ncbi:hypothetical protein ACQP1G_45420 [Nocardia sp. CA-107356]|uniref:hypothetical protein n=1 Tax=Nocardia sp. CA-107356 TaxID=3239972 RepID=UPI003D8E72BE